MSDRPATATRVALLLSCLVLSLSSPVQAAGRVDLPGAQPETLEGLTQDLVQADPAEQRYAARTLRSWIRTWVRQSATSGGDPITRDSARMDLETCDALVAPACVELLSQPGLTGPCADILGLLELPSTRAPLEAALAAETRNRVRRKLHKALDRLGPASP